MRIGRSTVGRGVPCQAWNPTPCVPDSVNRLCAPGCRLHPRNTQGSKGGGWDAPTPEPGEPRLFHLHSTSNASVMSNKI